MWFVFALLSAFFISVRKIGDKRLSHTLHYLTFGWALQLFTLPIAFFALLVAGEMYNPFTLGPGFWVPTVLLWVTFYPISTFLYVYAIKHGELSKILPLQSLGPIFALLLGWGFLNQVPSTAVALGIGVVISGIYILNLKGKYLHNPIAVFKNDKASLCMLLNLVVIAFAGVLNSIAIEASDPFYYSFISTLGAIPLLYMLAVVLNVKEIAEVKRNILPLSIAGGMFGASFVANMAAISMGPLAHVSTVRSSSALIGAVLGIIYLRESLTKPKIASLLLIAVGLIMVGLG
jgi:uncharacterized membrane protein